MTKVCIIVAVSNNGVIGNDGGIPWSLSDDLKRFKKITSGSPVIMGRKTWESLPFPLKNRSNIIISSNVSYEIANCDSRVFLVNSVTSALEKAIDEANYYNTDNIFVIGGATIYKAFEDMGVIDKYYITWVNGEFEGDTKHFPVIDGYKPIHNEEVIADDKNSNSSTFVIYEK